MIKNKFKQQLSHENNNQQLTHFLIFVAVRNKP